MPLTFAEVQLIRKLIDTNQTFRSFLAILSTNQPDLILPTVKSRCQLITLPEPTKEQASEYLKENNLTVEKGALAYFNSSPIQAIDQHDSYEKVKQITNILG